MELDSQAADTGRHKYTAKEVQYMQVYQIGMIGMDDKYLIVCCMMQERLNEIEQLYKQDVLGEYTASKDDPEHQTQSQIANVCDLSIIHKLMINVLLFSLHNDRRSRVPETH